MIERRVQIVNKLGLHARAAAKFVRTTSAFTSKIIVQKNGIEVDGKSILGILMLVASRGTYIILRVNGQDEKAAIDAVEALIASRFGERE